MMIFNLTFLQLITICFSAIIIGMSKTAIQSMVALAVPYMAMAFGAKASTGMIVPLLCMADIISVSYYRKTADLKTVLRLLPPTVVGFFVAIYVDSFVPVKAFKILLGATLLLVFGIMLWSEHSGKENRYSHTWWYAAVFGILSGFVALVANAAGAVMAIYLLSMKKDKMEFVGTNAWFFMLINFIKMPFQIFAWNNLSWEVVKLDLCMLPFIFLGATLGFVIVKRVSNKSFNIYIQVVTAISVVMMIFS